VAYRLGELVQGVAYDKNHVSEGTALYVSNCVFCHGVPGVDRGGNIANLGYSSQATIANLEQYLFGALARNGMPNFTGRLKPSDVDKLKAFIQGTADAIRPK
jgi:quinohemoprotein ethanol dehydrogenase